MTDFDIVQTLPSLCLKELTSTSHWFDPLVSAATQSAPTAPYTSQELISILQNHINLYLHLLNKVDTTSPSASISATPTKPIVTIASLRKTFPFHSSNAIHRYLMFESLLTTLTSKSLKNRIYLRLALLAIPILLNHGAGYHFFRVLVQSSGALSIVKQLVQLYTLFSANNFAHLFFYCTPLTFHTFIQLLYRIFIMPQTPKSVLLAISPVFLHLFMCLTSSKLFLPVHSQQSYFQLAKYPNFQNIDSGISHHYHLSSSLSPIQLIYMSFGSYSDTQNDTQTPSPTTLPTLRLHPAPPSTSPLNSLLLKPEAITTFSACISPLDAITQPNLPHFLSLSPAPHFVSPRSNDDNEPGSQCLPHDTSPSSFLIYPIVCLTRLAAMASQLSPAEWTNPQNVLKNILSPVLFQSFIALFTLHYSLENVSTPTASTTSSREDVTTPLAPALPHIQLSMVIHSSIFTFFQHIAAQPFLCPHLLNSSFFTMAAQTAMFPLIGTIRQDFQALDTIGNVVPSLFSFQQPELFSSTTTPSAQSSPQLSTPISLSNDHFIQQYHTFLTHVNVSIESLHYSRHFDLLSSMNKTSQNGDELYRMYWFVPYMGTSPLAHQYDDQGYIRQQEPPVRLPPNASSPFPNDVNFIYLSKSTESHGVLASSDSTLALPSFSLAQQLQHNIFPNSPFHTLACPAVSWYISDSGHVSLQPPADTIGTQYQSFYQIFSYDRVMSHAYQDFQQALPSSAAQHTISVTTYNHVIYCITTSIQFLVFIAYRFSNQDRLQLMTTHNLHHSIAELAIALRQLAQLTTYSIPIKSLSSSSSSISISYPVFSHQLGLIRQLFDVYLFFFELSHIPNADTSRQLILPTSSSSSSSSSAYFDTQHFTQVELFSMEPVHAMGKFQLGMYMASMLSSAGLYGIMSELLQTLSLTSHDVWLGTISPYFITIPSSNISYNSPQQSLLSAIPSNSQLHSSVLSWDAQQQPKQQQQPESQLEQVPDEGLLFDQRVLNQEPSSVSPPKYPIYDDIYECQRVLRHLGEWNAITNRGFVENNSPQPNTHGNSFLAFTNSSLQQRLLILNTFYEHFFIKITFLSQLVDLDLFRSDPDSMLTEYAHLNSTSDPTKVQQFQAISQTLKELFETQTFVSDLNFFSQTRQLLLESLYLATIEVQQPYRQIDMAFIGPIFFQNMRPEAKALADITFKSTPQPNHNNDNASACNTVTNNVSATSAPVVAHPLAISISNSFQMIDVFDSSLQSSNVKHTPNDDQLFSSRLSSILSPMGPFSFPRSQNTNQQLVFRLARGDSSFISADCVSKLRSSFHTDRENQPHDALHFAAYCYANVSSDLRTAIGLYFPHLDHLDISLTQIVLTQMRLVTKPHNLRVQWRSSFDYNSVEEFQALETADFKLRTRQ